MLSRERLAGYMASFISMNCLMCKERAAGADGFCPRGAFVCLALNARIKEAPIQV